MDSMVRFLIELKNLSWMLHGHLHGLTYRHVRRAHETVTVDAGSYGKYTGSPGFVLDCLTHIAAGESIRRRQTNKVVE